MSIYNTHSKKKKAENSIFQKRFKLCLKENGLTQETIAEKLDMSHDNIKRYMKKGANLPPLDVMMDMAKIFNVDLAYLVGDIPCKKYSDVTIEKASGLSRKAVENLRYYKEDGSGRIHILNILLSSNYFDQVLSYFGQFLDPDYCIPVHSDENGGDHISEIIGYDEDGIQQRTHHSIVLAKSEKDLGDQIEINLSTEFMETMAMNAIRDYLKDIKEEYYKRKGILSKKSKHPAIRKRTK